MPQTTCYGVRTKQVPERGSGSEGGLAVVASDAGSLKFEERHVLASEVDLRDQDAPIGSCADGFQLI